MAPEPFQIYQVQGFNAGTLALCKQPATDSDFVAIKDWNPSIVVTLTGDDEFPKTGQSLPHRFHKASFNWLHLPIVDFGIPYRKDRDLWLRAIAQLASILNANGRVLAHCKGGNGRSGMLLLKLLCLQGEDGEAAQLRIRAVRSGAIETEDQYRWATMPL